ncbi:hypothetical protein [Sulfitobacter pacificus]|uniref:hypothetical protein n=1 Tax=Sulfitobacter pacificus TaxID=1499314 RepID=UPI003102C8F5
MKVSVAFDVKNNFEVLESWPITQENATLFLERQDNVVKRVIVTFSNVNIENAPKVTEPGPHDPTLNIRMCGEAIAQRAIARILSWQAVISGLQTIDLDFDSYELGFHAESTDEDSKIPIKSFRSSYENLDSTCDFEQIGRAFCAGEVSPERIEYTSHYRDGRLAFAAGRSVDAYNNFFLFLETRYCDGKTKTKQQVELLSNNKDFLRSFSQASSNFPPKSRDELKHLNELFDTERPIKEKVEAIVNLRGKLRHHSLKSPHRWDPNKQAEYQEPARFLATVVSDIVLKETINDIYSKENLETFREISVSSGFETKIVVETFRTKPEPSLQINMSFPTTVMTSQLCSNAIREVLKACEQGGQIEDTTRIDATHDKNRLQVFDAELGVWALTEAQSIILNDSMKVIRCRFEHFRNGTILGDEFDFPVKLGSISIKHAWELLRFCLERIERVDPVMRVMSLKLSFGESKKFILVYRLGAQIKH